MLSSPKKAPTDAETASRPGLFGRLRAALERTRSTLVHGVRALFSRARPVDADLLEDLETVLLSADVGIDATREILASLEGRSKLEAEFTAEDALAVLRETMLEILSPVTAPLALPDPPQSPPNSPYVILVVGVNGTGKTTTIAKLAHRLVGQGRRVMLAAGDTFRAAAVEQLQSWGERIGAPVVCQGTGADSASVIFDTIQSARARGCDVVIADTAGRLHTQVGLMEELKKVRRVVAKCDPSAPHETLLVIDAGTGQNALTQAEQFQQAVGVTGLSLTKLDGTAKGGIVFAIARRLAIPIRFLGVGEGVEDLRDFAAEDFVDALLHD